MSYKRSRDVLDSKIEEIFDEANLTQNSVETISKNLSQSVGTLLNILNNLITEKSKLNLVTHTSLNDYSKLLINMINKGTPGAAKLNLNDSEIFDKIKNEYKDYCSSVSSIISKISKIGVLGEDTRLLTILKDTINTANIYRNKLKSILKTLKVTSKTLKHIKVTFEPKNTNWIVDPKWIIFAKFNDYFNTNNSINNDIKEFWETKKLEFVGLIRQDSLTNPTNTELISIFLNSSGNKWDDTKTNTEELVKAELEHKTDFEARYSALENLIIEKLQTFLLIIKPLLSTSKPELFEKYTYPILIGTKRTTSYLKNVFGINNNIKPACGNDNVLKFFNNDIKTYIDVGTGSILVDTSNNNTSFIDYSYGGSVGNDSIIKAIDELNKINIDIKTLVSQISNDGQHALVKSSYSLTHALDLGQSFKTLYVISESFEPVTTLSTIKEKLTNLKTLNKKYASTNNILLQIITSDLINDLEYYGRSAIDALNSYTLLTSKKESDIYTNDLTIASKISMINTYVDKYFKDAGIDRKTIKLLYKNYYTSYSSSITDATDPWKSSNGKDYELIVENINTSDDKSMLLPNFFKEYKYVTEFRNLIDTRIVYDEFNKYKKYESLFNIIIQKINSGPSDVLKLFNPYKAVFVDNKKIKLEFFDRGKNIYTSRHKFPIPETSALLNEHGIMQNEYWMFGQHENNNYTKIMENFLEHIIVSTFDQDTLKDVSLNLYMKFLANINYEKLKKNPNYGIYYVLLTKYLPFDQNKQKLYLSAGADTEPSTPFITPSSSRRSSMVVGELPSPLPHTSMLIEAASQVLSTADYLKEEIKSAKASILNYETLINPRIISKHKINYNELISQINEFKTVNMLNTPILKQIYASFVKKILAPTESDNYNVFVSELTIGDMTFFKKPEDIEYFISTFSGLINATLLFFNEYLTQNGINNILSQITSTGYFMYLFNNLMGSFHLDKNFSINYMLSYVINVNIDSSTFLTMIKSGGPINLSYFDAKSLDNLYLLKPLLNSNNVYEFFCSKLNNIGVYDPTLNNINIVFNCSDNRQVTLSEIFDEETTFYKIYNFYSTVNVDTANFKKIDDNIKNNLFNTKLLKMKLGFKNVSTVTKNTEIVNYMNDNMLSTILTNKDPLCFQVSGPSGSGKSVFVNGHIHPSTGEKIPGVLSLVQDSDLFLFDVYCTCFPITKLLKSKLKNLDVGAFKKTGNDFEYNKIKKFTTKIAIKLKSFIENGDIQKIQSLKNSMRRIKRTKNNDASSRSLTNYIITYNNTIKQIIDSPGDENPFIINETMSLLTKIIYDNPISGLWSLLINKINYSLYNNTNNYLLGGKKIENLSAFFISGKFNFNEFGNSMYYRLKHLDISTLPNIFNCKTSSQILTGEGAPTLKDEFDIVECLYFVNDNFTFINFKQILNRLNETITSKSFKETSIILNFIFSVLGINLPVFHRNDKYYNQFTNEQISKLDKVTILNYWFNNLTNNVIGCDTSPKITLVKKNNYIIPIGNSTNLNPSDTDLKNYSSFWIKQISTFFGENLIHDFKKNASTKLSLPSHHYVKTIFGFITINNLNEFPTENEEINKRFIFNTNRSLINKPFNIDNCNNYANINNYLVLYSNALEQAFYGIFSSFDLIYLDGVNIKLNLNDIDELTDENIKELNLYFSNFLKNNYSKGAAKRYTEFECNTYLNKYFYGMNKFNFVELFNLEKTLKIAENLKIDLYSDFLNIFKCYFIGKFHNNYSNCTDYDFFSKLFTPLQNIEGVFGDILYNEKCYLDVFSCYDNIHDSSNIALKNIYQLSVSNQQNLVCQSLNLICGIYSYVLFKGIYESSTIQNKDKIFINIVNKLNRDVYKPFGDIDLNTLELMFESTFINEYNNQRHEKSSTQKSIILKDFEHCLLDGFVKNCDMFLIDTDITRTLNERNSLSIRNSHNNFGIVLNNLKTNMCGKTVLTDIKHNNVDYNLRYKQYVPLLERSEYLNLMYIEPSKYVDNKKLLMKSENKQTIQNFDIYVLDPEKLKDENGRNSYFSIMEEF